MRRSLSFFNTGGGKLALLGLLLPAFPAVAADTPLGSMKASLETNAVYQDSKVSGTIVDQTGMPVIGANVFIGFQTQEVIVDGPTVSITLREDSQSLDEVVVVGYGSSVKKDLTTAVTSVKSKDFLPGAVNDAMQMIDGKVAGVTVSSTAASDPNASSSIQVRGASSLKAGNSPLVVIDGMPGGDLRNIAQQDIESITVLKDGSAAAIYGSRGANGVILVTTKQGHSGKTTITYDGYVEHDFVASKPDILDPESYLEHVTGAVDHGYRTDWIHYFPYLG